jgi:hypothetical protein
MLSRAWVVGALAAPGLQIVLRKLPAEQRRYILSTGLAGAALLYVAGAARAGSSRQLGWCAAGVVPFATVASMAMRAEPRRATRILAVGWMAHAFWDWTHERAHATAVPAWYAEMCQGFDILIAATLAAETLSSE